jgi:glycosyltransferase involved in cell wall biosynthesis
MDMSATAPTAAPARVLYVVYWGAAEPLGQSLVIPTIRRLSSLGVVTTLVTFEKSRDLENRLERQRIRDELASAGIEWIPLRYHKRPKWPATFFDTANGTARGVVAGLKNSVQVVHGRTFIGGIIGRCIAALIRKPFIYHNEGFYPDEQVDGGVWRNGSPAHRLARSIERHLYATARGLIALSRRACATLGALPEVKRRATPVVLVPSCVDLDRFRWRGPRPWRTGEELRLAYVGSIGERYVFERVAELVARGLAQGLDIRLRVLTPAEPRHVDGILVRHGISSGRYTVARVPYAEMPIELANNHAGVMVLTQGLSEYGCSPTKVGEYWAVGLPVVITPNISDSDEIIARERVGVVISGERPACYERALNELVQLLQDEDLAHRCRAAAERHYALVSAADRQASLYRQLVGSRIDTGGMRVTNR